MGNTLDHQHRWRSRLLWFCVGACAVYVIRRLLLQEHFGFHDWYLFIGQAQAFVETGQLYDRDLGHYAPSAAVYKFPPLYASLLVLLLKLGLNEHSIKLLIQCLTLLGYGCAVQGCLAVFRPALSPAQQRVFTPLCWIIALTFEPFFENYDSAQLEMLLLLLLMLALRQHRRGRDLLAGVCIGIAATVKIYPVYLGGLYLVRRNGSALAGMALGIAMSLLFSIACINMAEHFFYTTQILPTLLAEPISGRIENLSLARLLITVGATSTTTNTLCAALLVLPLLALARPQRHTATDTVFLLPTFTALLLFAMKNSWWNYQLLLLPALLLAVALTLALPQRRWLPACVTLTACLLVFWCNLGKLETLILFFTRVLETSALLSQVMLQTGLLRGLATFLVLLTLLYLRRRQIRA